MRLMGAGVRFVLGEETMNQQTKPTQPTRSNVGVSPSAPFRNPLTNPKPQTLYPRSLRRFFVHSTPRPLEPSTPFISNSDFQLIPAFPPRNSQLETRNSELENNLTDPPWSFTNENA